MSGLTFALKSTRSLMPAIAKAFANWKVEAGIFESAGKHNKSKNDETVAQIAHKNEYGIGVAERPAFRASFYDHRRKYQKKIRMITKKGLQANKLGKRDFDPLGKEVVVDIERSISSGPWLANSESTQLKKGGGHQRINSPLIDSGQMIDSVDYRVSK